MTSLWELTKKFDWITFMVLWPPFFFCWNLFHHFSKLHSTRDDTSASVDLSCERCSVILSKSRVHFFFHYKEKKTLHEWGDLPTSLQSKYSLDRQRDTQSQWRRKLIPNNWYLNNLWLYPLLKQWINWRLRQVHLYFFRRW